MKKTLLFSTLLFCSAQIQAQNVGIGIATPNASAKLDISATDRGLLVPRISIGNVALAAPVTAPATSLLVYNTNAAITGGNGVGFYYWTGTAWASLGKDAVDNGLYYNAGADRIRLGGALVEATTISQAGFNMTYDMTGTGNFLVNDAGVGKFEVRNTGLSYFGDDVFWNDANTGGTTLATLYDGGTGDDGVFDVYRNGSMQHSLNADGATVFNEQASATSTFRIESAANTNMLFVNAGTNRVGIGTGAPATELHVVGDARVSNLAGVGTRVVGSDVNGTLTNIAPGTDGQALTQTATGPAYRSPFTVNSTSLAADIQISSAAWANVPGMTVTFTATQTTAILMLSASGFAYTGAMSYIQFRVRNGAVSLGGTNTHMQSYDDVTGTTTPWSCTYTKKITGLVIGNVYTYTLQGQVGGILGTYNAAIFAATNPDFHHITLNVMQ